MDLHGFFFDTENINFPSWFFFFFFFLKEKNHNFLLLKET